MRRVAIQNAGGGGSTVTFAGDLSGNTTTQTVVSLTGTAGTIPVTCATMSFSETLTPTVKLAARSSDAATAALKLEGQTPYASATGANRVPGNLVLNIPAPSNSGTTRGYISIQDAGSEQFRIGKDANGAFITNGAVPATTGLIRLDNGTSIIELRRTDNSNIVALATDTSNTLYVGTSSAFNRQVDNIRMYSVSAVYLGVGSTTAVSMTSVEFATQCTTIAWTSTVTNPKIWQLGAVLNAAAQPLIVEAQSPNASNVSNKDGGRLRVRGGARTDTNGRRGAVSVQLNGTTETMLEACDVQSAATVASRVLSLCLGADVTTTQMPTNTGDLVIYISNCATAPTASAATGGILYAEAGALKWRGSGGTITTLGAA